MSSASLCSDNGSPLGVLTPRPRPRARLGATLAPTPMPGMMMMVMMLVLVVLVALVLVVLAMLLLPAGGLVAAGRPQLRTRVLSKGELRRTSSEP